MHETAATTSKPVPASPMLCLHPAAAANRSEGVPAQQSKSVGSMRERQSFSDSLSAVATVRSKSSVGAKKTDSQALQSGDGTQGIMARLLGNGFHTRQTGQATATEVSSHSGRRLPRTVACRNSQLVSALCSSRGSAEPLLTALRSATAGREQSGPGERLQPITGPLESLSEWTEVVAGMPCSNRDFSAGQISSRKEFLESVVAGTIRSSMTYRHSVLSTGMHSVAFSFAPNGQPTCSVQLTYAPDGLLTIYVSGMWYAGRERVSQKRALEQALQQIGFGQVVIVPGILESQP